MGSARPEATRAPCDRVVRARGLRRRVCEGQLKQREWIQRAIDRLQERHLLAWHWLRWELTGTDTGLQFTWD